MNRLTQYYEAQDSIDSRYVASEELKEESKNQCLGLGNRVGNSIEKVFNKLGELEDLEEELGCPIDVIFKAIKQNCIFTNFGQRFDLELKSRFYDGKSEIYMSYGDCALIVILKDYKKTWWLKEDKSE